MFGDLFGNMEENSKAVEAKLAALTVEGQAEDGAVKVLANGKHEVISIQIDPEKLDWTDQEQVLDLLVVALNRAMEKATAEGAEITQQMMKDMLPPGLGGLFGG